MIEVITTCPFCGKDHTVKVPFDGFFEWKAGAPIQIAMPSVSADDREMLISGICPKCWEDTFGGEEEF